MESSHANHDKDDKDDDDDDDTDDDMDDDVDDDDDVVVVERALSHLSGQPTLPPLCGATGGQTTLHTAKLYTALKPNCCAHFTLQKCTLQ